MSKVVVNINGVRICAFCKYWWDPACKYIQPYLHPQWYYEKDVKCRCIKRNMDMFAYASCNYYRCKIDF